MTGESIRTFNKFRIEDFPKGQISKFWLHIINNGLGEPIRVPILVARGHNDGPILGLNAALHGNELNGIYVIQRLFEKLDVSQLNGIVIGILVANVPGVLLGKRRFNDDFDLNRKAPGSDRGSPSSVYIYRLIDRVISKFDYLIDLHTTGKGKQNCWHIRANMENSTTERLARLQNPEVIIHSEADDHTLRGYCMSIGIKALTLELKDPMIFQHDVVEEALIGIENVMTDINMKEGKLLCSVNPTILCNKSRWIRSDEGGILIVFPDLLQRVKEKELIAEIRNVFGDVQKQFYAPSDCVIIARNTNPICQTGMGILNIGLNYIEIAEAET